WFWWWQTLRHANCRRKAIERTARNRVEFWSSRGTPPARVALSLSRVSPARHYNEACENGFRRVPHGRSPLPEPLVPCFRRRRYASPRFGCDAAIPVLGSATWV